MFCGGYTFTKSWTHPYLFQRVGPLWRMYDAPRKKPPYRREEWIVYQTPPATANRIIRNGFENGFAVCVFPSGEGSKDELKESWKGLGYRFHGTEQLFAHELEQIPSTKCDYRTERVTTQAVADELTAVHRHRQILPEHLAADPLNFRVWVAYDGEEIVGWVRSGFADGSTWCSNMFVLPNYRRRGIGKALMAEMLQSDKALGSKAAVLLASRAGSMLYPLVGYELIGELLIFTPISRDR